MTFRSIHWVEERVAKTLALEDAHGGFPVVDRATERRLDRDTKTIVSAIMGLPAEFTQDELSIVVGRACAPLGGSYREGLAETLVHALSLASENPRSFALV